MPLPSRADVGRTAFIVVWFVAAVATLSWKAPWFWTRPHGATASSAAAAQAADAGEAAEATGAPGAVDATGRPERATVAPRRDVSVAKASFVAPVTAAPQPVPAADETLEASLAHHEARVRENPADPDRLRALARVYEASGRFDAALDTYRRLESVAGPLSAEDQLHVARLLRWTGEPARAVPAYERYLALAGSDAVPEAHGEMGLALADSGRYREALSVLDNAIVKTPAEPTLYVGLARAADALGQPERSIDALLALAALRTLTADEAMWLTGRLEQSGRIGAGMPALKAALASAPDHAALWERVGDLEWVREQYVEALAAYEHVPADCAHGHVLRKSARSAAKAGRAGLAGQRYQQAIDCAHDDPALTLEVARFHGSIRQADVAVLFYERYAELATPATDVALEMTQTALAAERPDLALAWADAARARGDRSAALDYARAQALHLQNRPAEASAVLASVARARPGDPAVLEWQARTEFAQGRHLAAFRRLDSVLARGAGSRAEILVARGDAAAARGDVSRARSSYETARRVSQTPEALDLDLRMQQLERRTTPEIVVPAEIFGDSSSVSLTQAGANAALWLASTMRLQAGWSAGRVEQADYAFRRRAFSVHASEIFPTPAIRLELGAGIEDYGSVTLPVWQARVRRDLENGGHFAIDTMRHTPWSGDVRLGTARYNRISDLSSIGPSFHATGIRGAAELPLGARQSVRVDGGWRQYSDSNRQSDLYVHVQRELSARQDGSLWVAIQPQAYLESWTRLEPAYYSPNHHVSAGVGLRAQARRNSWTLDGTVTPQIVASDGAAGLGIFGSASVRRKVGFIWLGGEAAVFEDRRSSYRLHRFAAEVRIPLER